MGEWVEGKKERKKQFMSIYIARKLRCTRIEKEGEESIYREFPSSHIAMVRRVVECVVQEIDLHFQTSRFLLPEQMPIL